MDKSNLQLFEKAIKNQTAVYISADKLAISFQTSIIKIADNYLVLKNTVSPSYIKKFMDSDQFTFQLSVQNYKTKQLKSDGVHILFPINDSSINKHDRQAERFSFSSDEKVICEILNPFDQQTRISKPVLDMSAFGLSIHTTYNSKLMKAGTILPELKVLIDGEPYKTASGKIIYDRQLINPQGQHRIQVGIQFDSEV